MKKISNKILFNTNLPLRGIKGACLLFLLSFFLFAFSPNESSTYVSIKTIYGTITVKLYNETPQHRDNFLKLVNSHFYDSLLFHRCIKSFMIQGGDPDSKHAVAGTALGNGDVGYTIPAEFIPSLFHKRGALAAARESDDINPLKASSGCQFYIVQGRTFTDEQMDGMQSKWGVSISPEHRTVYKTLGGAPHLDGNYTVFGEVVDGMNAVDSIAAQKVDAMARPLTDIRMTDVKKTEAPSVPQGGK